MAREDRCHRATLEAEIFLRDKGVKRLPVDPFEIARELDVEVSAMPSSNRGVSGMLLRFGDAYGIAYATHIENEGFQRFSIGHELGHYLLPGHLDHVLTGNVKHESRAGFRTTDPYELEADHFAAGLLMPRSLFKNAIDEQPEPGLSAVIALSDLCVTSRTATAIQYARSSPDQVAIVLSTGKTIDYCFISDPLKEIRGLEWPRHGSALPKTMTYEFNRNMSNVAMGARAEQTVSLQDWFGGRWDAELLEEVVGLGSYGKTLTVLSATDVIDQDELDEEVDLEESRRPRFR